MAIRFRNKSCLVSLVLFPVCSITLSSRFHILRGLLPPGLASNASLGFTIYSTTKTSFPYNAITYYFPILIYVSRRGHVQKKPILRMISVAMASPHNDLGPISSTPVRRYPAFHEDWLPNLRPCCSVYRGSASLCLYLKTDFTTLLRPLRISVINTFYIFVKTH